MYGIAPKWRKVVVDIGLSRGKFGFFDRPKGKFAKRVELIDGMAVGESALNRIFEGFII